MMQSRAALVAAVVVALAVVAAVWWTSAPALGQPGDELWQHRNLGKAFYENPTTQQLAAEEFKKALDLAPNSARERVNYGLALLRAAKTKEGVAELERAQQQDPKIPHTWFNLGIAFKKESQYDKAIAQFERMVALVPAEPISHYNLGYLYKLTEKPAQALKEFEAAAALDPNLAGPHFQLFNAYRDAGRAADATREQQLFQEIKKRQAGAAVPEDLDWSVYAEILDPVDPGNAKDDGPPATLKFDDRVVAAATASSRVGLVALDANADGRPDLIAWSADAVRLFRNGDTLVENAGLGDLKDVRSVAVGDYNNDGFPDLCIIINSGPVLYLNNNGTFQKAATALPGGDFEKAVWVDYDHDYDLDLLLVGADQRLLRNNGQAGFSDQTSDFPFVAGKAVDAVVFNLLDNTSGRDVVVSYRDRPGVLYRDLLAGKYRAEPLPSLPAGAHPLVAADVDYDGEVDIIAGRTLLLNATPSGTSGTASASGTESGSVGGQAFRPAITLGTGAAVSVAAADFENRAVSDLVIDGAVLRNQSQGQFAAPGATVLAKAAALLVADFDNDGKLDAAAIAADGSVHLLHNATATTNKSIRVTLTGVRNPKLAADAQVEVKTGARYQKKTYTGLPLVFGVRDAAQIETVRITWPNGLIQNELKQPAGQAITYKEAQRLSGSCPMIFTWNGRGYQFITDVLGVAPLGASSGDGTFFPVDHDEYVQIPGEALQAVNGAYEVRVTEELREVSYLDQIQLVAVDHPAPIDLFTNDKFKAPPFPEFRLFGAERHVHPVAARDGRGADVRAALAARDRTYPDGFRRDYAGVAELHTLDLDFGRAAADNRAVLVLTGWVDWADGSTFLGASQEDPRGLILPSLQVKDAGGQWQTVVQDMGIPAGKPKTMAVDLTGKFLSASREVRIVTNLCVYWDEIFLLESSAPPPHVMTRLDAASAELRFRGFSTPTIHPARTQPESFEYARVTPVSMWNPTPGFYTRYGDVRPLVTSIDDRLVIMGSGDELRLLFPAAPLPPLPSGWRRDFLLLVDGWAKDADANTAFSQSVEPLPFHAMSAYPYASAERFPDDPLHADYRRTYNTRPALHLLRPLADPALSVRRGTR